MSHDDLIAARKECVRLVVELRDERAKRARVMSLWRRERRLAREAHRRAFREWCGDRRQLVETIDGLRRQLARASRSVP